MDETLAVVIEVCIRMSECIVYVCVCERVKRIVETSEAFVCVEMLTTCLYWLIIGLDGLEKLHLTTIFHAISAGYWE